MCITCGCGDHGHDHDHHHDHGHGPKHGHHHGGHSHDSAGEKPAPLGAVHDHGTSATRAIAVEEDILAENNRYAQANRALLQKRRIAAFNLMSSPGSGKTTLLARTLQEKAFPAVVIEGDQTTELDAERIRATGVRAVQINTGRGCHLDAHMVGHALDDLELESAGCDNGVVFIENVGNLVCPAAFDLGETAKVVLLSVTEGDDKPLKYPDMFRVADLMLITKADLLPYVSFDVKKCVASAKQINPALDCLSVSATTGEGLPAWFDWIKACLCR